MPKDNTEQKYCRICGAPKAFGHYGAIACRACGAFFRRLVTSALNYECSCKIDEQKFPKGEEMMENIIKCKGCRQQKCFGVGMRKDLVRAVDMRAFHQRRHQAMMANKKEEKDGQSSAVASSGPLQIQNRLHSNQMMEGRLIKCLLEINDLTHNHHLSPNILPMDYFEQFDSLESLLMDKKSLFAHHDPILTKPRNWLNAHQLLEIVKDTMYTSSQPVNQSSNPSSFGHQLLIFVNFARRLAAFNLLALEDQTALLRYSTAASLFLFFNYFAAQKKTETMITFDGNSIFSLFAQKYPTDAIVMNAAEKICILPVKKFQSMHLGKDELVLLMAMLFANSAIPGLSTNAQQILSAEEAKYGKALLGIQQHRFGQEAGALRYMETLELLWMGIGQAQRHRELATYIESVYEQGKYKKVLPSALLPLFI